MSRHSAGDLKQMQSLPLQVKIEMTKRRIAEWHEYWDGQVYVSFSGGKDSTVLKHIVDSMYDDTPSVFVNTGLEYPEIQKFVREIKAGKYPCFNSDVEILRPEMRFDEVIKKYGYPIISKEVSKKVSEARKKPDGSSAQFFKEGSTKATGYGGRFSLVKYAYLLDAPFLISSECCEALKKKPAKAYEKRTHRKAIIGTMAAESKLRESQWMQGGCNGFEEKRPLSKPMSFWTEQDVLHYIKEFDVPYCSVYGEIRLKRTKGDQAEGQINMIDYLGCYDSEDVLETTGRSRTGCMWCGFGAHLEKEPNRYQEMKQTYPKQYALFMDKFGWKEVLQYTGVPYE